MIAIAVTTMPLSIVSLSRKAATIASSRYGNANSASMISTRMRSTQPPTKPDISPSGTPIASENVTARKTTSTAVRAPKITRDRTSKPCTVVPQWLRSVGSPWVGKRPAASR